MAKVQETILFLERTDHKFVIKRRIQIIYFMLRRVTTGIEYSIVLPSGWQYLKSMNVQPWFYGLVLSITPLCGILSIPVIGWIYDKTKRGKEILYVLNSFAMIGCLVYSLPFSPWLPFFGRLLMGFGVAEMPIVQAEISWTRTYDKRFRIFALVPLAFFIGLSFGPPMNVAFNKINFSLGAWHIDYRNIPGILLVLLWLLLLFLNYFIYENLAKNYIDTDVNNTLSGNEAFDEANGKEAKGDKETLIQNINADDKSRDTIRENICTLLFNEILSTEIMALLFSYFAVWLFIFQGESLLPLVTQKDLHWSVTETSLVYLGGGAMVIVSYLLITLVSSRISDHIYLLVSLAVGCLGVVFLLTYHFLKGVHVAKEVFPVAGFIFAGMPEPLCSTSTKSILSQVVPLQIQGSVTGVFSNAGKISHIVGPLYGTLMYHYMLPCSVFNIGLFVLAFLWLLASIPKLNARKMKYER